MKPNPAHNTKDVKEMTDAELNEALAFGMDWKPVYETNADGRKVVFWWFFEGGQIPSFKWNPCQNYTHCREVEDFIFKNHLGRKWMKALKQSTGYQTCWLLQTTAPQRCEAAYVVLKEMKR